MNSNSSFPYTAHIHHQAMHLFGRPKIYVTRQLYCSFPSLLSQNNTKWEVHKKGKRKKQRHVRFNMFYGSSEELQQNFQTKNGGYSLARGGNPFSKDEDLHKTRRSREEHQQRELKKKRSTPRLQKVVGGLARCVRLYLSWGWIEL